MECFFLTLWSRYLRTNKMRKYHCHRPDNKGIVRVCLLRNACTRCISITEPSRWTSTLRDSSGTSNGSLVDFWGKLKNRSLYFYDLIWSKMSRNCILSVPELSYYYICHFYKIYRICSSAEAAFIKTIAVFTASTYWKDVFIT